MYYKILVLLIFTAVNYVVNANENIGLFKNEKAILFTANDGQQTDAYEGYIMVPENRNKANSRDIRVNYVRFPATGKLKGSPIIYLSGGPGGSGIGTAKWRRFPLFMALREHADVIALDQRGTGASEKMPYCVSDYAIGLTEAVPINQVEQRYRIAAAECVSNWTKQGADVLGYTTVQNAWDLNDLRQHFKAPKVTLWGISYGSHLALAAISLFEEHIDKVVIASAEGMDQTVKLPVNTSAYFKRVQQEINQHPELLAVYGDIVGRMQRVHQQLADKPIKLTLKDKDGSPMPFLLQKRHMQFLASRVISDPSEFLALLLSTHRDIEGGSYQSITKILERGMFNNEKIGFRMMSMAMDVASGITDARLEKVRQQKEDSLLGDLLNFPMPHLNKLVEGLDLGDNFRQPKSAEVSMLLLTGTLDGRTYIEGQKKAVAHLSNVTQVKVVNAGHNLFMSSPEVLSTMQQFLRGEKVETLTISVKAEFIEYLKQSL
ncbi:MAG: alpha/beta fold hydrolase [Paraglaciecola sp.]|uniref:alpha/beta fold hydrolase n=1 Tax=Paraglaciecola sp. TaxID=1920173 RepID=UPI00329939D0